MRFIFILIVLLNCQPLTAQRSDFMRKEALMPLVDRLAAFGRTIPQEKVYVHMDNTCYFQGDTIWFAAYTRQTTDDRPSRVSGVLYVELLNNDGYLVERKMIEMREGRGSGFFVLDNVIQYSGFYELRAYTRWQLNWGCYEHKHSRIASRWFASKELEQEFYRDYEKLYSRVFPVYDRPKEAGDYAHDMTMRTMRRYFRKDMGKQEPTLTLFPEGGNLVAGVENRVAFEAVMSDGQWLKGSLTPNSLTPTPDSVANAQLAIAPRRGEVPAVNRGRGVFTIVPERGMEREVTFTTEDGQIVKATLPKPEERGVALCVTENGKELKIQATANDAALASHLGMTIMHEGRVEEFLTFRDSVLTFDFVPAIYRAGVHQVTVFDDEGRVWADRLFFSRGKESFQPNITIKADKEQYDPQQPIVLDIETKPHPRPLSEEREEGIISLAVRDKAHQDYLFDNASILTEMLLSSEIRGFVPDPGWYFEADDSLRRAALDLLMMTQGWRRFNWRDMAVRGAWDLTQPDEKAPIITGYVFQPPFDLKETIVSSLISPSEQLFNEEKSKAENIDDETPSDESTEGKEKMRRETQKNSAEESEPRRQEEKKVKKVKGKEGLLVHAELSNLVIHESAVFESGTKDGHFTLRLPRYYGPNYLFVSVDDTTTWKGPHPKNWVTPIEDDSEYMTAAALAHSTPPKYYAHISWPYSRFVQPYDYYQNRVMVQDEGEKSATHTLDDGTRVLGEVAVHARHGGLRRFDDSQPAMVLDAYEAVNAAIDAGLFECDNPVARTFLSDYGLKMPKAASEDGERQTNRIKTRFGLGPTRRGLPQYIDIPLDSVYHPKYLTSLSWTFSDMSPGERRDFDALSKLDRIYIYTDYQPRLEGDKRYEASNLPETRLVIYPYPDGSRRTVYKDGKYVIHGFCPPAEFYSPNYSRYKLPEGQKDYRRTLYWNPNLKLDAEGRARVTLFNNSRTTQIEVEAAGQAADGTLLWNK